MKAVIKFKQNFKKLTGVELAFDGIPCHEPDFILILLLNPLRKVFDAQLFADERFTLSHSEFKLDLKLGILFSVIKDSLVWVYY